MQANREAPWNLATHRWTVTAAGCACKELGRVQRTFDCGIAFARAFVVNGAQRLKADCVSEVPRLMRRGWIPFRRTT